MSLDVSAPAPLPWDPSEIVARALTVLRLDAADADADRVADAADEACALIDAELDYATPPSSIPPPVVGAAVTLTVELYRRKDAPFGVTDSWSIDGAVVRLSSDYLRGVRAELAPYVSRRGVA